MLYLSYECVLSRSNFLAHSQCSIFTLLSTCASCDLYFDVFPSAINAFNISMLSSVEIIPPPPNDTCSIPDLLGPLSHHRLSLLPGGRLVVCGGRPSSQSCIVWMRGSTSWTHLHTIRSSYYISHTNKELNQQHGKECPCGLDSNISSQLHRAARRLG